MPDPDLFSYDVTPTTVRCSPDVSHPNVVEIRLTATNRTGHAVTCPQITIEIPSANKPECPTKLTTDPEKIVAVPGPRSPWAVFAGGNGVWYAVPVPPATGLGVGETVTVVCSDIIVNVLPGDVELQFGQVVVEGEHEKTVPAKALLKKVKTLADPAPDAIPT